MNTLTFNTTFLRQRDLVTPQLLGFPILVIGAGGIGSWSTLALGKMGCTNITILDFDHVAEHNIPSQLYVPQHESYPKVLALQTLLEQLTGTTIKPVQKAFQEYAQDKNYGSYQVIICAVDSLIQRREIWELIKKTKQFKSLKLYIDARMGGEIIRIISINMKDKKAVRQYEENLTTNTKAHRDVCTARAIVFNTLICGGLLAATIKKYAKKETIKSNFTFDIASYSVI